jgi:hypothetical protein
MGSFRDSTLDSALIAPLVASVVGERYEIRLGTVTSRGATTSGELRELCAVEADYLQIGTLDLNHCMPLLAKQRGYTTMAIHAFSGGFYGRHQWYPRLGFDSIWFIEEVIHRRDLRMCGTGFYGARDWSAMNSRPAVPLIRD